METKKNKPICDVATCFMCKNCLPDWHNAIKNNKTNIKLRKGEQIFTEGQPVTGIYFVYNGVIKVTKQWDEDKELIIRFAKDGAILGHRGLGGGQCYPISATALEPSTVCYVDMAFFESTMRVNNALTMELVNFFANELRTSERRMRNLAHMSVKGRVADALLKLNDQFGSSPDGFIGITLSRQDLASYAGATYETVFRVINDLVNDNIIALSGKNIAIANMAALTDLGQSAD